MSTKHFVTVENIKAEWPGKLEVMTDDSKVWIVTFLPSEIFSAPELIELLTASIILIGSGEGKEHNAGF